MGRILVVLVFLFTACTNNNGETSRLSSIDSNAANNTSIIESDKILIQGFTQMPSIINNCSALFVNDTTNEGTNEYYFVTDLKGTAFIKLNVCNTFPVNVVVPKLLKIPLFTRLPFIVTSMFEAAYKAPPLFIINRLSKVRLLKKV